MKKKRLCGFLCTALSVVMLFGCGATKEAANGNAGGQETTDDQQDEPGTNQTHTDSDASATDTDTPDTGSAQENGSVSEEGKKIGIAMPSQSSERWASDASNMKKGLEAKGYTVDIQFAEDDPKQQEAQIESFIAAQADCIVVAAADPSSLASVADAAGDAGIPIIAYDRLLMDTDAVSYYVAFDHKGIGTAIGKSIAEKAGLDGLPDDGYKTIEFFMGPQDDLNASILYEGVMEVLQPYLDTGKLVCKTDRTSFENTSISGWSQETAQQWCENYLAGYYMDEELDICAAVVDGFAYGCIQALQKAGYTEANWPVISGQDCEITACKNILDGTQSFSVYKDTRILAQQCVSVVEAVINGTELEISDMERYDNHKMVVPAFLCAPAAVDQDNMQEMLIDSGYYTSEQISAAE
ncbi:MAG: sugar-binding protein [Eubacterium sp.]|nr:sugar-binding protein [Eubacterium sp.]